MFGIHDALLLRGLMATLFVGLMCLAACGQSGVPTVDDLGRFNVKRFGAKGDGQTDDTKAFQAALDAAAQVAGTVFVPAGTFRVGQLTWHDHTAMVGDPGWSYYVPGGSVLELNDANAACLLDFTYCQGARLYGLSLVGRDLGKGIHGILTKSHDTNEKPGKWKREDFPAIERCMVRGFTGNGLDMDVWCLSLRGCAIGYNRGDGFNYRHADALVIDTWFSNNGGAGVRAEVGTGSSTFTANRIEWNSGGNMVVRNAWGWNITGNSFDRAGGPGLYLVGNCHDFSITGNLFLRSGATLNRGQELAEYDRCAVRLDGVDGLTFTGNSITVGGNDAGMGKAVSTPDYGLIIHDLRYAVITGNRLQGVKQPLLDLGEHGDQVMVRDNVLQVTAVDARRLPPAPVALHGLNTVPTIDALAKVLAEESTFPFQQARAAVESTPEGPVARMEGFGPVLGEARLAVAGGNLLLHARVLDGRCTPVVQAWPASAAIEIYTWQPGMPRGRQWKIVPTGLDGRFTLSSCGWQAKADKGLEYVEWKASGTVTITPLTPCGYLVSAIIPFTELGLAANADAFFLELAVSAAEKTAVKHLTAFHSERPLFLDTPADAYAAVTIKAR